MLRIPALGLVLDHLVGLGHVSGRREQPGTALGVGWFTDGPVPGEPGVAVLSGHAGFGYTAGAFARLGKLEHGDTIIVGDDERPRIPLHRRQGGALPGGRAGQQARRPRRRRPRAAADHQRRRPTTTPGSRSTRVAVSAIPAV